MDGASELVHATAIALGGHAALIRGASGSGKSDLALRCMAAPSSPLLPEAALLVSDDQVRVRRAAPHALEVSAPESIEGRIEIRGLGIRAVPFVRRARLALVVDLVSPEAVERYPLNPHVAGLLGMEVPLIRLAPFETSAHIKLLLALVSAREAQIL